MPLPSGTITRLLGAIETDTLVILCGAGLSRASPSNLYSALDVARACYDRWSEVEPLDAALRDDLDGLAGHFWDAGRFDPEFLRIVPWDELVGPPNVGHAAVADMLVTNAARAVLTSNFDWLIESWAGTHKVDIQGSLTGHDAAAATGTPLLKFHGCMLRGRNQTLWTAKQLTENRTAERVRNCAEWISLILPGKHLVVVGFWTDWCYLNHVLAQAFATQNAASVTVIDPKPTADLEKAAPHLWKTLNSLSGLFEHFVESGADALQELRTVFSKAWTRRYYSLGTAVATNAGVPVAVEAPFEPLSGEDLYRVRCDAEGVPYSRAARLKAPPPSAAQAAYFRVRLLNAGAVQAGAWLKHQGESIRVINGAGEDLATVRAKYCEPPTVPQPTLSVAAGAFDLGVPDRVIASGFGSSMVRPAPGGESRWQTDSEAAMELSL